MIRWLALLTILMGNFLTGLHANDRPVKEERELEQFVQRYIFPEWFIADSFVNPYRYEQQVSHFTCEIHQKAFATKLLEYFRHKNYLLNSANSALDTLYNRYWFHLGKAIRRVMYTLIGVSIMVNAHRQKQIDILLFQLILGSLITCKAVQSGVSHAKQLQATDDLAKFYSKEICTSLDMLEAENNKNTDLE